MHIMKHNETSSRSAEFSPDTVDPDVLADMTTITGLKFTFERTDEESRTGRSLFIEGDHEDPVAFVTDMDAKYNPEGDGQVSFVALPHEGKVIGEIRGVEGVNGLKTVVERYREGSGEGKRRLRGSVNEAVRVVSSQRDRRVGKSLLATMDKAAAAAQNNSARIDPDVAVHHSSGSRR